MQEVADRIARFRLHTTECVLVPDHDGDFVRYEDHVTALRTAREDGYRQGVGARVKPLVWAEPPISETLTAAKTILGTYRVWTHYQADGRWWAALYDERIGGSPLWSVSVANEAEGHAAAQHDYEQRIMSALAEPGDGWQPIKDARKDGTVIWALFRPDIFPGLRPGRDDLARWNGVQVPLRHPGLAEDGFDMGWNIAAPVGHGGFPDEWIAGYRPLPSPPRTPSPGDTGE